MTEIVVEIHKIKGCKPCDDLFDKIKPILKEKEIPLSLIKDKHPNINAVYPVMCVVQKEGGLEIRRRCVSGYSDEVGDDLLKMLNFD